MLYFFLFFFSKKFLLWKENEYFWEEYYENIRFRKMEASKLIN